MRGGRRFEISDTGGSDFGFPCLSDIFDDAFVVAHLFPVWTGFCHGLFDDPSVDFGLGGGFLKRGVSKIV